MELWIIWTWNPSKTSIQIFTYTISVDTGFVFFFLYTCEMYMVRHYDIIPKFEIELV